MNEEDGGTARAFPGRFIDELKSARLHGVERYLRALHSKGNVRQTAAAAVALDQLLYRRVRRQRFEQLNKIRAIPDLQQGFAHLIASAYLLAVYFPKAHHLVAFDLAIQLSLLDCDSYVVDKFNSRNIFQIF